MTVGSLRRRRRPRGEDPAVAAGATSPPLAWQDVDLRRGCGGDAFVNAHAVDDEDYNDDSGDGGGDGGDSDCGRDLVIALRADDGHSKRLSTTIPRRTTTTTTTTTIHTLAVLSTWQGYLGSIPDEYS